MGGETWTYKAVWWLPGLVYGVGVKQQWVGPTANAHTIVLQLIAHKHKNSVRTLTPHATYRYSVFVSIRFCV
jgi:uncharacterized protein YhjY with autotransporter beta-barrel domain